MKTIAIDCEGVLVDTLRQFGDGVLYRGQTKHYVDAAGVVQVRSSQDRRGCVPELLARWSKYASALIRALAGSGQPAPGNEMVQAILQHYGWRSFYVDVSKDSAVAAWFASHAYVSENVMQLCEDCWEESIILHREFASYVPHDGVGHLYVLSASVLSRENLAVEDLTEVDVDVGSRLRFHAQQACLVGPLSSQLPDDAFIAHLEVSADVLRRYAASKSLVTTAHLFPNRSEDPVLALLLALPWEQLSDTHPVYGRSLQLPEYDGTFSKRHGEETAFFRGFWCCDNERRGFLEKAVFFKSPGDILFGWETGEVGPLPRLYAILKEGVDIVVEANGIYRHPELQDSSSYQKGVVVQRDPDGTIDVSELMVEHPGTQVAEVCGQTGWKYRVLDDGAWERTKLAESCSCNNPERHVKLLYMLSYVEWMIEQNQFVKVKGDYWHRDFAPLRR